MKPPLHRRWLRSVRYCSNSCRLSYRLHRRPRPERKMSEKIKVVQGEKLRGAEKLARIPIKVIPTDELPRKPDWIRVRSEEHTSELQSRENLVCRLLLEKKN